MAFSVKHLDRPQVIYRIVKSKLEDSAFSGEGARLFGGRWNNPGKPVIYTSENRSLALLEMLVQNHPLRLDYLVIPAYLPKSLSICSLPENKLPSDWRDNLNYISTRTVSEKWLLDQKACVLEVPSAVLPSEKNFILNPLHQDFSKIKIGKPEKISIDSRLISKLS